ncbi:hypothetical protein ACFLX3_02060 [Chloroflexota bacterium]
MASVHPGLRLGTGLMGGKLTTQSETALTASELFTYIPAAQVFFDELSKKGWRHYFIDGYGTALVELDIDSLQYNLKAAEYPRGGITYTLSIDFERHVPRAQLKGIVNLQRFIVNICSQSQPRGVTVDLAKNEITYVHDSLWGLKGKKGIEEAKEILDIVQWLIKEKEFKLGVDDGKRYQELVTILEGK